MRDVIIPECGGPAEGSRGERYAISIDLSLGRICGEEGVRVMWVKIWEAGWKVYFV